MSPENGRAAALVVALLSAAVVGVRAEPATRSQALDVVIDQLPPSSGANDVPGSQSDRLAAWMKDCHYDAEGVRLIGAVLGAIQAQDDGSLMANMRALLALERSTSAQIDDELAPLGAALKDWRRGMALTVLGERMTVKSCPLLLGKFQRVHGTSADSLHRFVAAHRSELDAP